MPAEFTGEQKLRIVLESIIRGVPLQEQCKKYSITPDQFKSWHDHLIKNGGKIYEIGTPRTTRSTRTRKVRFVPWYIKLFLILSIFTNLAVAIVWGVWFLTEKTDAGPFPAVVSETSFSWANKELNSSEKSALLNTPDSLDDLIEQVDRSTQDPEVKDGSNLTTSEFTENSKANLEEIITPALRLPKPPSTFELENRVDFLDQPYEAKHVVYVMDVGSYQFKDPVGTERLERMKLAILESLTKLSSNSYFNLVLCWNLREAHALGKTILRANDENKRYATEWITSLGSSPDSLKEGRSQFYPKELLYAQVLPGVIGPWYGLATAVSYDPDVVFFLAGNMPDFSPDEVSKNDYNGLGLSQSVNDLASPRGDDLGEELSTLIRKTAGLWLVALQSERNLPDDQTKIEDIALRKLSLDSIEPQLISRKFSIPWDKAFDNFLAGIEMGISKIPRVHVFQTLPEHIEWPLVLQRSMEEFCESTRGSLHPFP